MNRATIYAAAAAIFFVLPAAMPAQATVAGASLAGLSQATPALVQDVRYRSHRNWRHNRGWRHHSRRHRHCWNHRVRVSVRHGHFVYRTVRRCGWRSW